MKNNEAKIIPMPQTIDGGSVDIKLEPSAPPSEANQIKDALETILDAVQDVAVDFVLSGQADANLIAVTLDYLQELKREYRPSTFSARYASAIPIALVVGLILSILDVVTDCVHLINSGASPGLGLIARLSTHIISTPSGGVAPLSFAVTGFAMLVIMTLLLALPISVILKHREAKALKDIDDTIAEIHQTYSAYH